MVVTRYGKNKYAGSWHKSKSAAIKFGKKLKTRFIVTKRPKKYYKF